MIRRDRTPQARAAALDGRRVLAGRFQERGQRQHLFADSARRGNLVRLRATSGQSRYRLGHLDCVCPALGLLGCRVGLGNEDYPTLGPSHTPEATSPTHGRLGTQHGGGSHHGDCDSRSDH